VTHAVKIDNPLAAAAELRSPPPPEIVNLKIDFDGTLAWNGSPVDRPPSGYIVQEPRRTRNLKCISRSTSSPVRKVAQTLADLQSRGLKKIGFRQQRIVLISTIGRIARASALDAPFVEKPHKQIQNLWYEVIYESIHPVYSARSILGVLLRPRASP